MRYTEEHHDLHDKVETVVDMLLADDLELITDCLAVEYQVFYESDFTISDIAVEFLVTFGGPNIRVLYFANSEHFVVKGVWSDTAYERSLTLDPYSLIQNECASIAESVRDRLER